MTSDRADDAISLAMLIARRLGARWAELQRSDCIVILAHNELLELAHEILETVQQPPESNLTGK